MLKSFGRNAYPAVIGRENYNITVCRIVNYSIKNR